MRLFVFSLCLLILTVCGNGVSAQDAFGAYPRNQYRDPQFAPVSPPSGDAYRWRPLDEESDKGSPGPTVRDYTDEPFGLPAGTYRPIEERHTVTPHLEGYRFRPIVPEEQMRNRASNQRQEQVLSDESYIRSQESGNGMRGDPMSRPTPNFSFRPDPRLDTPTRGAPPRYAFPMGSAAPRFRSQ